MLKLLPLALALSTDAFAAALGRGLQAPVRSLPRALQTGLAFGSVEGLMCLTGLWFGGTFADIIGAFDHWIALILLCLVGLLMIRSGLKRPDESRGHPADKPAFITTLIIAVATSLDSATVGVALALSEASLLAPALIGMTSFLAATTAFLIAPLFGHRLGRWAEFLGGCLLIAIGIRLFSENALGPAL